MRQTLDNQLAVFLRKRRGQITYAAFAKKLGITPSSLFRLENCQQSATLKTLQQIMDRLKCSWADVFSERG
jgi:transcriptional regulator with XRE-family HTH domain